MALYYYSRYTLDATYTNRISTGWNANIINTTDTSLTGNTGYAFYITQGFIGHLPSTVMAGSEDGIWSSPIYIDSTLHDTITRVQLKGTVAGSIQKYSGIWETSTRTLDRQGDYLATLIAEDGTYPDNGKSGSYWYVKGALAFPQLEFKIDGVLKTAEMGWTRIDGVLYQIESIKLRIGDVLKET